jgi:hypothetical protein
MAQLGTLNGQIVSIRSELVFTNEVFALSNRGECPVPFITANRIWAPCIDLEVPTMGEVVREGRTRGSSTEKDESVGIDARLRLEKVLKRIMEIHTQNAALIRDSLKDVPTYAIPEAALRIRGFTNIRMTVVGKLRVVKDDIRHAAPPGNPSPGHRREVPVGFGHLSVCPAQMIVTEITDMSELIR